MVKEDLVAEQIAVERYRHILKDAGSDPCR
jgi:hypothetical protein